jgi:two-component system sensor histidine kinase TctE
VTVDSSRRDAVSVEIEDYGVGIAEPHRELIFERFYRAGGNEVPGTGLGLPIVRSIAAQHRASVQVRPNPSERGSVFTVIFPRLPVVSQREAA